MTNYVNSYKAIEDFRKDFSNFLHSKQNCEKDDVCIAPRCNFRNTSLKMLIEAHTTRIEFLRDLFPRLLL